LTDLFRNIGICNRSEDTKVRDIGFAAGPHMYRDFVQDCGGRGVVAYVNGIEECLSPIL
jgi:hypothetical protein